MFKGHLELIAQMGAIAVVLSARHQQLMGPLGVRQIDAEVLDWMAGWVDGWVGWWAGGWVDGVGWMEWRGCVMVLVLMAWVVEH